MLLLHLDAYHLGDPLFLAGFARDLLRARQPVLLVHGSGEAGERALEADGLVPERRDGVWVVQTSHEAALVERATRDLNRQIAHALTDAGVPAIRLLASDRGLLRPTPEGLAAGSVGWLRTLAEQRTVPVVAALVEQAGADGVAREVPAAEVLHRLATALTAPGSVPTVVAWTRNRRDGLYLDGARRAMAGFADPAVYAVAADPEAVHTLAEAQVQTLLTSPRGLWAAENPLGTWLI